MESAKESTKHRIFILGKLNKLSMLTLCDLSYSILPKKLASLLAKLA